MAADVRALMRHVGHVLFDVVGHDRGSYVAFRLAMDHAEAATHLAVLDCIPIVEHLERCDDRFAAAWWHWFFFAQPDKPERAITANRQPGRCCDTGCTAPGQPVMVPLPAMPARKPSADR